MMHKISFTALAKPTRSQAWQPLSLTLPFPLPSAYSPTASPSLLSLIDAHQSIWQHFQGAQSLSLSRFLSLAYSHFLSLSLLLLGIIVDFQPRPSLPSYRLAGQFIYAMRVRCLCKQFIYLEIFCHLSA